MPYYPKKIQIIKVIWKRKKGTGPFFRKKEVSFHPQTENQKKWPAEKNGKKWGQAPFSVPFSV